ncbi:hypothetical protein Tco_0083837 [Tanacetum coccineum]
MMTLKLRRQSSSCYRIFLRGKRKDDQMELLEAFGFHPVIGIKVLMQKALITVTSEGKFDMHDLVQEMGHYIVRGEHPDNPEKHTRVWKREEINNLCHGIQHGSSGLTRNSSKHEEAKSVKDQIVKFLNAYISFK